MKVNTKRTARVRVKPSFPTTKFEDLFKSHKVHTILDYGCGRGHDVKWLTKKGYDVFGYDPNFQPAKPDDVYDAIMCNYVLCVLPNPQIRRGVIRDIMSHTGYKTLVCLSVRSKRDINAAAKLGQWERKNDGWLTSAGTFQRGYTKEELLRLIDPRREYEEDDRVLLTWSNSWSVGVVVES